MDLFDIFTYELMGIIRSVAGFLSAIASSSGLIALSVLLLIGIPPQMALGTNKLYSITLLKTVPPTLIAIMAIYSYLKNSSNYLIHLYSFLDLFV